jgi:phosphoribosylaminoimidazole-succinocarboxamide synthase
MHRRQWFSSTFKIKADNSQQYLRDWLTNSGLKGKDGVGMPEEVVAETASKYREAFTKITGQSGL